MNSNYYEIKKNITLKQFIIDFEKSIKNHKVFTAIKLDDKKKIIGVITRGDLRRLIYKKDGFKDRIDKYLNLNPVVVKNTELNNNLNSLLSHKTKGKIIDDIIVINEKKKFLEIIKYEHIKDNFKYKNTCVIGMGHIGLPLSIFVLKKFKNIIGYDNNNNKIKNIKKVKLDFYEKNLNKLLKNHLKTKRLKLTNNLKNINSEIYIICIGSIISGNKISNSNLKKLAQDLSGIIKKNDLIILRGTVSTSLSGIKAK